MKTKLMAMLLICALMLCGVCMAEDARPRLDTADRIVYQITNGKYRILNMDGKFVGDDTDAFPTDMIGETAVYMENGRFGYVAKDGTILIDPEYLELPVFENGFAVVCREDVDAQEMDDFSGTSNFPHIYGVIDAYGEIVVPIEYAYASIGSGSDYAVISEKGEDYALSGLFDLKQKKIVIEPKYYSLDYPKDGTMVATECTVNHNGEDISGSEYDYRCGIVNLQDDVLVPFEYGQIEYNEGFNAYVCYNAGEIEMIYEIQNGKLVEKET